MVDARILIISIIGIVVFVAILTSLGPTIVDQTCTHGFNASGLNEESCALENASASSKTMYSLIEILYPIVGVIILVSIGFALHKRG
jgi:hypothetical protein